MTLLATLRHHLAAVGGLLLFRPGSAERLAPDSATATRSLHTLWFEAPYALTVGYIVDQPDLEKFAVPVWVYFVFRGWSYVARLLATFWLVRLHAQWQGAGEHNARWITAFNWMNVLTDLLLLPFLLYSLMVPLTREELIVMGTATYLFIIYSYWALTWQVLKVNPFFAAGVAMIPVFISDMLYNFSNLKMFGSIRPFFDQ